jgi:4-aminobutyrate aminotransferase/(S)-3-amino-2-methylpropionate transaminase
MGPIVYASARGSNVVDVDGNVYVDLTAGFGAELLGHQHPRVLAALEAQSVRLCHALGDVYTADARIALMESVAALFPEPRARVILGQSGADAVTAALKTAMLATAKPGVIAFEGSYHGMSYAPLAASGLRASYRDPFAAQLNPHVRFVPFPRSGEVDRSLTEVRKALAAGDVGSVLVEPILGRGGCVPSPPSFLRELASLTSAAGALLIADEIWTGLGRAGSMLTTVDEEVTADLICLGKGLGGGLPISACVGRESVMQAWAKGPEETVHTATFHGAPLACATALALLDVLKAEQIPQRARRVGAAWMDQIREACSGIPAVLDVRGRGMMIGIEIDGSGRAMAISRMLLERGYIVLTGGTRGETLTLTPPLVIAENLLASFVDALRETLRASEIDPHEENR